LTVFGFAGAIFWMVNCPNARLIAFYLPQFHPIAENDQWWGRGFTEWTNVAKARPLFPGHYQPHLPGDLGFYDLRVPEVRETQADLARNHGIEAFCYWHYWFHGKRLLERPFEEVLKSGRPKFPFCLAWVNESWSRRWLGEDKDILQKQTYSFEDDKTHAKWLAEAFSDSRYLRVNGRPMLIIYRPHDLPDSARTTEIFRQECVKLGVAEPYLLAINGFRPETDYTKLGFDGTINTEPQFSGLPGIFDKHGQNDETWRLSRFMRNLKMGIRHGRLRVYDYSDSRRVMTAQKRPFPVYAGIFVGWDNTPRRGQDAIVLVNSTPEAFELGLREIIRDTSHKPFEDRLVFIAAWNEWAEGNHLEPDQRYGLGHLEAVKRANLEMIPGTAFSNSLCSMQSMKAKH
jgi:lipopolysaccharide biosynthesis protein